MQTHFQLINCESFRTSKTLWAFLKRLKSLKWSEICSIYEFSRPLMSETKNLRQKSTSWSKFSCCVFVLQTETLPRLCRQLKVLKHFLFVVWASLTSWIRRFEAICCVGMCGLLVDEHAVNKHRNKQTNPTLIFEVEWFLTAAQDCLPPHLDICIKISSSESFLPFFVPTIIVSSASNVSLLGLRGAWRWIFEQCLWCSSCDWGPMIPPSNLTSWQNLHRLFRIFSRLQNWADWISRSSTSSNLQVISFPKRPRSEDSSNYRLPTRRHWFVMLGA